MFRKEETLRNACGRARFFNAKKKQQNSSFIVLSIFVLSEYQISQCCTRFEANKAVSVKFKMLLEYDAILLWTGTSTSSPKALTASTSG